MDELRQHHDQVLEQPLRDLLAARRLPYDANVTSLRARGGNVPIAIAGVGEIDLLFLDVANQLVYVCECKHNRARFDYPNWRRNYSNFVGTYERKLTNKVNWVRQHLGAVEAHFRALTGDNQLSLAGFTVRGIFAIKPPPSICTTASAAPIPFTTSGRCWMGSTGTLFSVHQRRHRSGAGSTPSLLCQSGANAAAGLAALATVLRCLGNCW